MSKKIPIILIAAIFVLAVALGLVFWFAVKPLYTGDFFENTFEELFPDNPELSKNISFWEENGYDGKTNVYLSKELIGLDSSLSFFLNNISYGKSSDEGSTTITVKTDNTDLTLELLYDDRTITLKGLFGDDITISRKTVRSDLEGSIFAPYSGTAFALSQESFEELTNLMENIVSTNSSNSANQINSEELGKAFEAILSKTAKQIKSDSTLLFFHNGLISRKAELLLDKNTVLTFLDAVSEEAENNDALKNFLQNFSYTKESNGAHEGDVYPLSYNSLIAAGGKTLYGIEAIKAMKSEFDKEFDSFEFKISYLTNGKLLENLTLDLNTNKGSEKTGKLTVKIDFIITEKEAKCNLSAESLFDSKSTLTVNYAKLKNTSDFLANLTLEASYYYDDILEEDSISVDIEYSRETGNFTIDITDGETEDVITIEGTYRVDSEKHTLLFSIDKIYENYDVVYKWTLLKIRIEEPALTKEEFTVPKATEILHADEFEMELYLMSLPMYEIETMYYELTGQTLGFFYTNDRYLLFDGEEAMNAINECIYKYNNRGSACLNDEVQNTYIYLEEYNVYVVFYYSSHQGSQVVEIYAVLPEGAMNFYPAMYDENGNFIIHDLEFVKEGIFDYGIVYEMYICRDCGETFYAY